MTHTWNPELYDVYADERARPFLDLLARIRPEAGHPGVASIVDLGCGIGELTATLAYRWPDADVLGIDSSPEMLAAARPLSGPRLRFEQADLREWLRDAERVDVLVSNAVLQWVPGHLDLMSALVGSIRPGGWLAFQVPGNLDTPMHALRRELAARPQYAEHLEGVAAPASHEPADYLATLTALGCAVDAWETTYLHVLTGTDPVLAWASGTGARPTLQALPTGLREEFVAEYRELLRAAYPSSPTGMVMPFRRVFAVARVAG